MLPRRLILLLLDRADSEREPRDAVGLFGLDDLFGEPHRLFDFAAGQQRKEGAIEKFLVARIRAQGGAIIGCRS